MAEPAILKLSPATATVHTSLDLYVPWVLPKGASSSRKRQWGRQGTRRDVQGRHVKFYDAYDKDANRRVEHVEDLATGEIIIDVDHPLTEHRGHGSAKFKQDRPED